MDSLLFERDGREECKGRGEGGGDCFIQKTERKSKKKRRTRKGEKGGKEGHSLISRDRYKRKKEKGGRSKGR